MRPMPSSATSSGVQTVNEVRAEEGLPPNGDVIYSGQGIELGEKPPGPVAPAGDKKPKKHAPSSLWLAASGSVRKSYPPRSGG